MNTQDSSHGPRSRGVATAQQPHFPSEWELLHESPFFRDSFGHDIQECCRRLKAELGDSDSTLARVLSAGANGNASESMENLRLLAAFLTNPAGISEASTKAVGLRFQYYLARVGDTKAAGLISQVAATMALQEINEPAGMRMASVALSWAVMAHQLSGLTASEDLQATVASVDHLRRNTQRSFARAFEVKS